MLPDKPFLLGRFEPEHDSRFVGFQNHLRETHFLLQDAYQALMLLLQAAADDGVNLEVLSSTRNFNRQKAIWEAKWNGKTSVSGFEPKEFQALSGKEKALAIMRYSAMPGTSRHHWGTEVDLNSLETEYFSSSEGRLVLDWLENNAPRFGFYRPYTNKGTQRPHGYEAEPWHWSYAPLSKDFLNSYLKLVQYSDIKDFDGAEYAREVQAIAHYVMGVADV